MNDSTATTPIKTGIDPNSTDNTVAGTKSVTVNSEQRRAWRAVLKVHPAAEVFPPMSDAELRKLADDIKASGLREPIAVYGDPEIGDCVLDCRNRLDALELIGREITSRSASGNYRNEKIFRFVGSDDAINPVAYVISANIHRRHLTSEQRRNLIAGVLKRKPQTSNRQIAQQVAADDKTVGKVRANLEATAEIPQLNTTTGKDGRARPTRRHIPEPMPLEPAPLLIERKRQTSKPLSPDDFMRRAFPLLEGLCTWPTCRGTHTSIS
jgi:hypothetical protein